MDEELVDDTAQVAVAEGSQQRHGREDDFAVNAESRKILKSRGIRIPANEDCDDIQRGENVVKAVGYGAASQHSRTSLFMDDADVMVEELTVKSYDGSNLDIGTSNNRKQMYNNRPNHWQNPTQVARESGFGNSPSDAGHRKNVQGTSSAREDIGPASFPELLVRKSLSDGQGSAMEHVVAGANTEGAGNVHGGMRTKIISKSGFTEYFIKNTLKGKGIVCKGPSRDQNQIKTGIGTDQNQMKTGIGSDQIQMKTGVGRDQSQMKTGMGRDQTQLNTGIDTDQSQMKGIGTRLNSNVSLNHSSKPAKSPTYSVTVPRSGKSDNDGVTLREWLKAGHFRASKVERLNIFRKIVDLVDDSHSQGVALPNLFPSYIKLLPSNQVEYLGLPIQKQMLDSVVNSKVLHIDNSFIGKRLPGQVMFHSLDTRPKKQKLNEDVRVTGSDFCLETARDSKVNAIGSQDYCNECEEDIQFFKHNIGKISGIPHFCNAGQLPSTSLCERMEYKWYRSPEGGCTTSSNIYCLGVLLFELLGHFDSERAHIAAMSDLQHRILPPVFLSENPKEAGFCLWLLHPEPSSRPSTREILQSEVINGLQELYSENLLSSIDQDDAESELLLHFLISSEKQKQKDAFKLVEEIRCLESDIEEVKKRHDSRKSLAPSSLQNDCSSQNEIMPVKKELLSLEMLPSIPPICVENESRLIRNICHLESAYFSMRSKVHLSETETATHPDKDILRNRESWSVAQKGKGQHKRKDTLGTFFDGLCKYVRFSKFEVRGVLRNTDFNNPANVTCSLSFDRDEDYFASAGISKKIKIFDFSALCNDSVDIHYPVVEMSNRSKLSCVCWNNYIKNYLASTDYDGVVKLWDASTGQELSQFTEHEKRAWSVDFSPVCPTKLASGSDDCSVKLWSISERNSLGTIRNVANVCCVQFSAYSSHLLAFGSVDSSTYCYDLRNLRSPWCVLAGHRKAVSYVKFLDSETLVSASTDNTLKIWDLNKASPVDLSANACSLTLSGHTNEKNFVGLSVADGYIACGSETNEIYTYYRSLPMPITSHKFGSVDPISGKDTDDDNGQFVSSVCWKGKSDMLIAANSSGCIKLLQMV